MIEYTNKINKLVISGYRGFTRTEVNFCDGSFFVIAGENAMGKTSILEAINLCFDDKTSRYAEICESDFNSGEPIEIECFLDNPFYFIYEHKDFKRLIPCKHFKKVIKHRDVKESGQLLSSRYNVKVEYYPESYSYSKKEVIDIESNLKLTGQRSLDQRLIMRLKMISKNTFEYETISNVIETVEIIGFEYLKKLAFPQVFYLDNDRNREILFGYRTSLNKIVEEISWRYYKNLSMERKEVKLAYDALSEKINKVDSSVQGLLLPTKSIISKLLNDEKIVSTLGLHFLDIDDPYRNSMFGVESENQRLVLAKLLGSGYEIVISLSLVIALARESKTPSIILIDEPELHLEATIQKQIVRFFTELKEFQTIVTSHSHIFVNKENLECNQIIERKSESDLVMKPCTAMDVADLQMRLLGNDLDDLFIPECIVLVEGKYDKKFFMKAIPLVKTSAKQIQIVDVGGKDCIPEKSENYEVVISSLLAKGKWYSEYLKQHIKIVVDGDVTEEKIDGWVQKFGFNKEKQIVKLSKKCLEYLYPKNIVLEFAKNTVLTDGSNLASKGFDEIIKIILEDESKKLDKKEQIENRISKQKLNDIVVSGLTVSLVGQDDFIEIKNIITWIYDE